MDAHRGPKTILLTGATGYVGGRLLPELLDAGHTVRCLVRDPGRRRGQLPGAAEVVGGDVVTGEGLDEALAGADVAFYLVHSMESGAGGDFAERDRRAARTFGDAVRRAGVARTVYLGGLEDDAGGQSEHLRSRHEVAELLAERVPCLVHVRAAMVVGAGSASFVMLRSLVERLPAMVCPRWVDTPSQPVSIVDVVRTLAELADRDEVPREVQLGGADVLTYREMMERYARVAGRRAPAIVKVPLLSPRLSSYWVGLVTPVESALARPLVEGLGAEMVVREPPPEGINDAPLGFDEAVRVALRG
ncbi:NAD(P)H-binding protein [Conexibacter sp. SYSU D00693]|uniref:NAD(P)H-binding protein n=1 Tax=Conexibacter sp. SYSU D00693 TaxID=2812560 RepID=UPI00196AFF08|nr:NAD(P)H-binding protein [Conexibacter sp. SYSU D00693]